MIGKKKTAVLIVDGKEIRVGNKVRVTTLVSTAGFIVDPKAIQARRVGAKGKILGYVPGHGGEVWWVKHSDGEVAVYFHKEFEILRGKKECQEN